MPPIPSSAACLLRPPRTADSVPFPPLSAVPVLLALALLACAEGGADAQREGGELDSVSAALDAEMAKFPERYAEEPVPLMEVAEVKDLLDRDADVLVIDAREPESYAQGHLPGAVNYPFGNWLEEGKPLPPTDRDLIVYCNNRDCPIGRLWSEQAVQHGYTRVRHMKAGLAGWKEAGLPVETDGTTGET